MPPKTRTAEEEKRQPPKGAEGATAKVDPKIDAGTTLIEPSAEDKSAEGKADRQKLQDTLGLTETKEVQNPDNKIYFKLGKHDKGFKKGKTNDAAEDAKIDALQKKTATHLYGWVDGTEFQKISHTPAWYNGYIEAAKEIIKGNYLLDSKTQEWFDYVNEDGLINDFAGLGTFNQTKWNTLKKGKAEKIYAKDGLFNFLLAWRRVKKIHPVLDDLDKEDFNSEQYPNLIKGSITLGFSNKIDDQDFRFAAKEEEAVPEEELPKPPDEDQDEEPDEDQEPQPGATDGKATIFPDGKMTLKPDGKAVLLPDGKALLRPDGKYTLHPDGKFTLKPDTVSGKLPDGVTTIRPDGVTTLLPDGKTNILPDGKTVIMPDKTTTLLPDGKTVIMPDGSKILMPDGKITILPDGSTTTVPNGKATILPDGKATILPDGSTLLAPNGTATLNPQDGIITIKPDGSTKLKTDGTYIIRPDGVLTIVPDGTTTIDTSKAQPNGTYTLNTDGTANLKPNNPQDGIYQTQPDGTYTLKADGTHIIKFQADGKYTILENGTGVLQEVKAEPAKQDGKYTIAQDGSATLAPTDESKKTHYTLAPDGAYTLKPNSDKEIKLRPDGTYTLTSLKDEETTLPSATITPGGAGAQANMPQVVAATAATAATVATLAPSQGQNATVAATANSTGVATAAPVQQQVATDAVQEQPKIKDPYDYKIVKEGGNTIIVVTKETEETRISIDQKVLDAQQINISIIGDDEDKFIQFKKGDKSSWAEFDKDSGEFKTGNIENNGNLLDYYSISYDKGNNAISITLKDPRIYTLDDSDATYTQIKVENKDYPERTNTLKIAKSTLQTEGITCTIEKLEMSGFIKLTKGEKVMYARYNLDSKKLEIVYIGNDGDKDLSKDYNVTLNNNEIKIESKVPKVTVRLDSGKDLHGFGAFM